MSLPIYQTSDKNFSLMQTQWSSQLNPIIGASLPAGHVIPNVVLNIGNTSINHLLGKNLTGWFLVRQRSAAQVYDAQDGNQQSALTLILVSNAKVTVDVFVF